MSLNTFKLTNPGVEGVRLYLASNNSVTALTVSSTGCDGKNYAPSLEVLESITINGVELIINSKEVYSEYYFYETQPTSFNPNSDTLVTGSCTGIIFNPFLQGIDFTYNDYNALLGNSSELKQSGYIYEVDRKVNQIIPSNLSAILSGSAVKAQVQDSNYSSLGFTNGRYLGTKTNTLDYGNEPALSPSLFQGSLHSFSKSASSICSQSIEERKIEDLLYTTNQLAAGASNTEYPDVRLQYIMTKTNSDYESFSTTDTIITIYQDLDIQKGDILRSAVGSELLKVENITKLGTPVTSSIEVERQYYSQYTGAQGALNPVAGNDPLNLVKILGDTIYSVENSTPYRVLEKKLWVEETQNILIIDNFGTVLHSEESCSV